MLSSGCGHGLGLGVVGLVPAMGPTVGFARSAGCDVGTTSHAPEAERSPDGERTVGVAHLPRAVAHGDDTRHVPCFAAGTA